MLKITTNLILNQRVMPLSESKWRCQLCLSANFFFRKFAIPLVASSKSIFSVFFENHKVCILFLEHQTQKPHKNNTQTIVVWIKQREMLVSAPASKKTQIQSFFCWCKFEPSFFFYLCYELNNRKSRRIWNSIKIHRKTDHWCWDVWFCCGRLWSLDRSLIVSFVLFLFRFLVYIC